jgi:hypothetical protein
MKVQVNLDEQTMNVTEKHEKSSILVTVRLIHQDIRDSDVRTQMNKVWTDLAPLKDLIEQVILETTASNVAFITPVAYDEASKI